MCVSLVYDSTWRCYESTILRQCDCECVWTIVAHTPKTHWVELSGFYSVVGRLNVVFSDNIKFRSELRYCRTAAACSIGLRYENTHTNQKVPNSAYTRHGIPFGSRRVTHWRLNRMSSFTSSMQRTCIRRRCFHVGICMTTAFETSTIGDEVDFMRPS